MSESDAHFLMFVADCGWAEAVWFWRFLYGGRGGGVVDWQQTQKR
jgi:hypothetical protein